MSINHAALHFIFPQLHSGTQLDAGFFFICKCESRVQRNSTFACRWFGRACYFTRTELSQGGLQKNSVYTLLGKKEKKNTKTLMQICSFLCSTQGPVGIHSTLAPHVTLVQNRCYQSRIEASRGGGWGGGVMQVAWRYPLHVWLWRFWLSVLPLADAARESYMQTNDVLRLFSGSLSKEGWAQVAFCKS